MRSRGVYEFNYYAGRFWKYNSRRRLLVESGQSLDRLIDSTWTPISASGYTPCRYWDNHPLPTLINSWDKDFWMMKQITSIPKNIKLLERIYDTLISRDEEQFYNDYIPLIWSKAITRDHMYYIIERLTNNTSLAAINLAISRVPSKYTLELAKKNGIEIKDRRLVIWGRREYIKNFEYGVTAIRVYNAIGDKLFTKGIPYINRKDYDLYFFT